MIRTIGLLASASLAFCSGCSELGTCPEESDVVVPIENRMTDREALVYSSSPWAGPRDHFPAKQLMRFEHNLMVTPEVVVSYVSFEPEGSSQSENAGNQGIIRCVDDTDIWLKNDTCEEDFYVRVAAWASGTTQMTCPCEKQFDGTCPDN